ncbi:MAG: tetratricopeptide repeat protein [Hyphomonadaceae bacterium]
MQDCYGNSVSTRSDAAMRHYDGACELIRLYRGDPIAALDAALAEDPDFTLGWAVRAGLLAQQMDKAYAEEAERSLRAGEASAARGTDWERAHLAAARDWAEGRFAQAVFGYARIAQQNPRDLIALQSAHVGCFYLGMQSELRDWPLQGLRAFSRDDAGYHAILGMAAFGLEECGDFAKAEAMGREAQAMEPRDGWAVHAVAHVNEMRGDAANGIDWLTRTANGWAPESGFAYHNWWHLALLHLDRGEIADVLKLYDEKVRPARNSILLECTDASALLWRLHLEGVDVSERFQPLAEDWAHTIEDGHYAFNDLHALMALLGAGRSEDVKALIAQLKRTASGDGDNAYMTRAVGLPLAEAFAAFDAGRHAEAFEKIIFVRGIAQRFGGSHAQRDILTLTALHAALRAGMKPAAEALAAERLAHKPQSPWARGLAERVAKLSAARAAA